MWKLLGRAALLCAPVLLLPLALRAQTASLVANVNPSTTAVGPGDANPRQLLAWREKVFFFASSRTAGGQIWATDGTDAGTQMLLDACQQCGAGAMLAGPQGGVLFTRLQGGETQIWRSDGTRAGTVPLVYAGEILFPPPNPGPPDRYGVATPQTAYFAACTASRGCGAWRSDGTLAGTQPISPSPAPPSPPNLFSLAGDRVFFVEFTSTSTLLWTVRGSGPATRLRSFAIGGIADLATTGDKAFFLHGNELWSSDGTPAGTQRLKIFRSFPIFGAWLKPIGNRLYLPADDGASGVQIWQSDGTPEGTRRITAFAGSDALNNLDPRKVGEAGNRLVFLGSNGQETKAWSIPLATAPAAPVDLCGARCSLTYDSTDLAPAGGRLLFVAQGGASEEIWSTDGTPAGTAILASPCQGTCNLITTPFYPGAGGTLFFQANGALWRTDGTAAGTRSYSDGPLYISTTVTDFAQLGDRIFFSAQTPDYSLPTYYGQELWTSDGQPGGTRIVTDLANRAGSSYPANFTALGDSVYFLACDDDLFGGQELWRGSAAGAEELTSGSRSDCQSTDTIQQLVRAGQHLFFWRTAENFDTTLWTSDGTAAGTRRLTTHDEDFSRGETALVPFRDRVYWIEGDEEIPLQVWASDGTPAGTGKAFDLPDAATKPIGVVAAGGALYVLAISPAQGFQIWTTDGTAAALQKVFAKNLDPYDASYAAFGSSLVVFTRDSSQRYELWTVNGGGAAHLRDFVARPSRVTELQGAFYFFSQTQTSSPDFALWRSDGTAAGTTRVYGFPRPAEPGFGPIATTATMFAGRLYFTIDDGVHGAELWRSDGTAAGSALVTDLDPGPAGSAPSSLAVAGGRLFFAADDGVHGSELWRSDGTAAGTHLVEDLAPEGASSNPAGMTAVGDRLYFAADDGVWGTEPWSLPLSGAATCVPAATALCLNGGRFRVELVWRTPDGRTGSGQAVGLTADTGYFWFFDPANVEAVVKVLDGRGLNNHFWVFYGALSNVEYTLTVTDTQTGLTRHYFNPAGQFGSVGDTQGFGPLGEDSTTLLAAPSPRPRITQGTAPAAPAGCQPGPARLCLNGNRFAVEATWKDFSGNSGSGQAVGLTGDTGYFWFFDRSNVEVILKVLDGTATNGKFWVFYGALSNVEYTLTVTNTATGQTRTYTNPPGRFASVGDTSAF